LAELAARHRPHLLAGEEHLPLEWALRELLGTPGLRRGSTIVVSGATGSGATSLALAVPAGASAAGSWVAVVDLPRLGVVAASELGLATDRLLLVPDSGGRFATVVTALLDACDVVIAAPPAGLEPALARRLAARARQRRAVLVVAAGATAATARPAGAGAGGSERAWSEGVDARLAVVPASWDGEEGVRRFGWSGLGDGHGRVRARLVDVVATRRRSAPPQVRLRLWLPSPAGTVSLATPATIGAVAEMAPLELAR
jgi:RecA/RadA recombinase